MNEIGVARRAQENKYIFVYRCKITNSNFK